MHEILSAVLCCGLPASVCGLLAGALLLTVAAVPLSCCAFLAVLPLLFGAVLAGFRAGKRRRRDGIRSGLLTALLLTACWYLVCSLLNRCLRPPLLLLLTLPCGMLGGVLGVNTKLPLPQKRCSLVRRLPLRVALGFRICRERRRAKRAAADNPTKAALPDAKKR